MVKFILELVKKGLGLSVIATIIGTIVYFITGHTFVNCITYANFYLFLAIFIYVFFTGLFSNQSRAARASNFWYQQGGYFRFDQEFKDSEQLVSHGLSLFIISLVPLLISFILYKVFFPINHLF